MKLVTLTAPDYTDGPVVLREVKEHLRVTDDVDDGLVERIRLTAIRNVSNHCGRPLAPGRYEAQFDYWHSRFELPIAPISAVQEIVYRDSSEQELLVSDSVWIASTSGSPGVVALRYGQSWPTATLSPVRPVRIRFTAGYARFSEVPSEITQAILLWCDHLYDHTSEVLVGETAAIASTRIQGGVAHLIGEYVVDHFGSLYGQ